MKGIRSKRLFTCLLMVFTVALSAGLFLSVYQKDNKYTAPGPRGENGALLLSEGSLQQYPVVQLVHGWEYYGGVLLAPGDFYAGSQPRPDRYVFIGQYGGFDMGDASASPHGSASYRLNIAIPQDARSYTLSLPEIFSACRVYVNGEFLAAMGEVDAAAYHPQTGNRVVSFEASDRVEIIIAVADYSHFYSGMVYPPAFGLSEAVNGMLSARLSFHTALCAAAVVIGVLSLLVGFAAKRHAPALLYGLLCLCYLGFAGYPVWKTFSSGYSVSYMIENLSFCAMLLLVLLLQRSINGKRLMRGRDAWAVWFGIAMCAFAVITHLLLPLGSAAWMNLYSYAVMLYEWLAAAYITTMALRALWSGEGFAGGSAAQGSSLPLLLGILMFDCALIMDRLLPWHEPIVTGWFIELASFALLLCIGVSIGMEVARQYRERAVLVDRAHRMEQVFAMQKTYQDEIGRQTEEARAVKHDLRHHFRVISGLLAEGEYEQLREYISQYEEAMPQEASVGLCAHPAVNVLAQYYTYLAKQNGIRMTMRIDMESAIGIADTDLAALLSNLLENAIEACLRVPDGKRWISIALSQRDDVFSVYMENSAAQVLQKGAAFQSAKEPGRDGYGLASIRGVAEKYSGKATFQYDEDREVFMSGVVMHLAGSPPAETIPT